MTRSGLIILLLCLLPGCIYAPNRSTPHHGEKNPAGFRRELRFNSAGYVRYDGSDDVAGDLEFAVRTFTSDRLPGIFPLVRFNASTSRFG